MSERYDPARGYGACVRDLVSDGKIYEMRSFCQHGSTDCFTHCLYVSYVGYRIGTILGLRGAEIARGALLHDYFLYDWHAPSHGRFHAFTHPRTALRNAEKRFVLTERERDIILKHMWPVTPTPPKHVSGFVVTIADKYCALMETFGLNRRFQRLLPHLSQALDGEAKHG